MLFLLMACYAFVQLSEAMDLTNTIEMDQETDVDATDSFGNTPLMLAASNADPELVASLLLKGANPYLTNKANLTALDIAKGHYIMGGAKSGVIYDEQQSKWFAWRKSESIVPDSSNCIYKKIRCESNEIKSKKSNKIIAMPYGFKRQENAARASDILARKLMCNGERLDTKLNFYDDDIESTPYETEILLAKMADCVSILETDWVKLAFLLKNHK
jgi:hypothetical protein